MTVHLVGAGPGDPDLLTLRAARLLGAADVVVHDRLVGRAILELTRPGAELIDVGKAPAGRGWPQHAINDLLVRLALVHPTVVRLKGGDPFVFGRGGEEAEALRDAGVDVAVVPGISSALAAPAAAGIPVTQRGCASGFTVVTAHQDPATDREIDWDALARLGTTLVVLMGAARAARVAARLLAAGMAASTPVAVVTSATCDDQQTFRTCLDRLLRLPVRSPAVIVIGAVAALDVTRTQLWTELAPVLAEGVPA
jgi:uroporphyrin-III C-methyltransferase